MDEVSKLLDDRKRKRPRLFPYVVLAVVLHGSAVVAAFLFGRAAAARPAQLPVVSVRLVQPQRPPTRRNRDSRPRPTPVPQPTAALTQPPAAVPEPTIAAPSEVSEDAMPAPESSVTPAPRREPEPAPSGRGLSLGEGASRSLPGIPADFHFTYYVERMLALIESRWYKPVAPEGTRARVRFRILKGGRVEGIELEESSGDSSFDRAALRALYAANPLPPLPPAYRKPSLTVHLAFSE